MRRKNNINQANVDQNWRRSQNGEVNESVNELEIEKLRLN